MVVRDWFILKPTMLYKFKSKVTADLIMLEPNGRRMLEIVGKEPGPQGIILSKDMPAAIAALDDYSDVDAVAVVADPALGATAISAAA